MRAYLAAARVQGQVSVPLPIVDGWAAEVEAAAREPDYGYPRYPLIQYTSPYFHPIRTFLFPFSRRTRVRVL